MRILNVGGAESLDAKWVIGSVVAAAAGFELDEVGPSLAEQTTSWTSRGLW
jgi:hypothetical protein